MKRILTFIFLIAVFTAYSNISAQATDSTKTPIQHGKNFVDKNGDGYNDNAPDHDGDGIPNGLDPDFLGMKAQHGRKAFVDLNGDGIKDNAQVGKGKGRFGNMTGPGARAMGPKDGTGNNGNSANNPNQGSNGRGKKHGRK